MSRASGQSDNLLSAIEEYGMLQRGDKVLIALSVDRFYGTDCTS